MNLKKYTEKDRYGNMFSYEFDVPSMQEIPQPDPEIFKPKGTDTVPAMLTPGENVVNAEASRLPGVQPMLDKLNDKGRAIQEQQGGPIPSYNADGGVITDEMMPSVLDGMRMVESGGDVNAVSEVGAAGPYQIMKATGLKPGYGVEAISGADRFNEVKSRAFAKQYLQGIMKAHPEFTKDEVITAYHSGVGNVLKAKGGVEELGPRGQAYAGKVNTAMGVPEVIEYDATPQESGFMSAQAASNEIPEPVDQDMYAGMNLREVQRFDRGIDDDIIMDSLGNVQAVNPNRIDKNIPIKLAEKFAKDGNKKSYDYYLNEYDKAVKQDEAYKKDQERVTVEKNTKENKIIENEVSILDKKIAEAKKNNDTTLLEVLNQKKNDLIKSKKEIPLSEEQKQKEKADAEQKKKEAAKVISDQLANEEDIDQTVMNNEEVADYIKKNPGKTPTDKFIDKAKEVGGVILEKSMEYFKDAFSSMFDGEELARMAFIYAGSRAMGYDHGASLNYGMKNYMKRVDANLAAAKEFALTEKARDDFEMDSLKEYSRTGDIDVLIPKKSSGGMGGGTGSRLWLQGYGIIEKVKTGKYKDGVIIPGVNSNNPIPLDHELVRGKWSTYDDDLMDSNKLDAKYTKSLQLMEKQANTNLPEGSKEVKVNIPMLAAASTQLAMNDMIKYGAKPRESQEIRSNIAKAQDLYMKAYRKHIIDPEENDKPNSIEAYYNQLMIRLRTRTPGKGDGISYNEVKNTSSENFKIVDDRIISSLGSGTKNEQAVAYRKEWQELQDIWRKATADQRKVWNDGAKEQKRWDGFSWWLNNFQQDPTGPAGKLVK